jgi:hypothetical protein
MVINGALEGLSSLDDRLENKVHESSSTATPLSSSPGDLSRTDSARILSYEEQIAAKMKEGEKNRSTRGALSSYSSSRTVEEFEACFTPKAKNRSRNESPSASPSYEDRAKNKLNEGSLAKPNRSTSGNLNRTDSARRPDSFEERVAAKVKKEESYSSAISSSELKLQQKLARKTREME